MKQYLFWFIGFIVVSLSLGLIITAHRAHKNSFDTKLPVPNTFISFGASINGFYDRGVRLAADSVPEDGVGGFLGSLTVANLLSSGEDGSIIHMSVYKKQSTQSLRRDIEERRFNNRSIAQEESSGRFQEVKNKTYYLFPITDTMGNPTWVAMTYGKNEAIIVQLIFSGYSDLEVLKESKTDDSLLKVLSHINFD